MPSQVALVVKNPPANRGDIRDMGLISGWEEPLEEEMATHSSILAWRIMDRGAWQAAVHRITKSQTWLKWLSKKASNRHITVCSVQFSSVAQSCPTLCDPMNCSMPGLAVHHQHPEFTQTHIHWDSEAIQPSPPLSSPTPPAPNPSWHQSLFQWVNSSHEVAKVLEFQL